MHADHARALNDYGALYWLLQDETIPGHIGDHLADALVDLGALLHVPDLPPPPDGQPPDAVTVLGRVRARIQAAILDAHERSEMLALGRVGRELALAERDLTRRPCPALLATRDEAGARAAIRR